MASAGLQPNRVPRVWSLWGFCPESLDANKRRQREGKEQEQKKTKKEREREDYNVLPTPLRTGPVGSVDLKHRSQAPDFWQNVTPGASSFTRPLGRFVSSLMHQVVSEETLVVTETPEG